MATIAKLDSNGVQVLPEGQRGKTTSPQVSSTDYSLPVDGKYLANVHVIQYIEKEHSIIAFDISL